MRAKSVLSMMVFMISVISTSWAATLVDMNSADAAQFDAMLDGVGAKKAQILVEWRQKHGAFGSVDDVAKVKGFGSALAQRNKAKMRFGSKVAQPASRSYGDKLDNNTLVVPLH